MRMGKLTLIAGAGIVGLVSLVGGAGCNEIHYTGNWGSSSEERAVLAVTGAAIGQRSAETGNVGGMMIGQGMVNSAFQQPNVNNQQVNIYNQGSANSDYQQNIAEDWVPQVCNGWVDRNGDGSLNRVEFWMDHNNNGRIDEGEFIGRKYEFPLSVPLEILDHSVGNIGWQAMGKYMIFQINRVNDRQVIHTIASPVNVDDCVTRVRFSPENLKDMGVGDYEFRFFWGRDYTQESSGMVHSQGILRLRDFSR